MSIKTGVIFGRVTSKAKNTRSSNGGWDYSISNGSRLTLKTDDLCMGKWYFFEVSKDILENYQYVSHCLLNTDEAVSTDQRIEELLKSSIKVVKSWKSLQSSDRQILMREVGIGLTAAGAASAGCSGLFTMLAAETVGGFLSGGVTLLVSGGLATISYLQYEERKEALSLKTRQLSEFRRLRSRFVRSMYKMTPSQYDHLDCWDPQITSIVTRMKGMINNFDVSQFFETEDSNYQYSYS